MRFRPDLLWSYSDHMPDEALDWDLTGVRTAIFSGDVPRDPARRTIRLGQRTDFYFTSGRGYVTEARGLGVKNPVYCFEPFDPSLHYPVAPDRRFRGEVAFIGQVGPDYPRRNELFAALNDHFDFAAYGRHWEETLGIRPRCEHAYPRQFRSICASTDIMLEMPCRTDLELYFSNRTWLTLACGGFLLMPYVPSLEELFNNHEHLVWFNSTEECIELVRHYLPREQERHDIAAAGCEYVHTYHTNRHVAAQIIEHVFGRQRPQ
jgi:spore maturation protein CgeB